MNRYSTQTAFLLAAVCSLVANTASADPVDYERDVKPLLKARCYACHGGLKQKAGLRLDAVEAKTFELLIDKMEQFDRMTMMIERRRNSIVREIARYRTEFSHQAQRAIEAEGAASPGSAAQGGAARGRAS